MKYFIKLPRFHSKLYFQKCCHEIGQCCSVLQKGGSFRHTGNMGGNEWIQLSSNTFWSKYTLRSLNVQMTQSFCSNMNCKYHNHHGIRGDLQSKLLKLWVANNQQNKQTTSECHHGRAQDSIFLLKKKINPYFRSCLISFLSGTT